MRRLAFILCLSVLLTACSYKSSEMPVTTSTPMVEVFPTSYTLGIALPGKPIATQSAQAKQDESALAALSRIHKVQTKHFSFGDTVDVIDQVPGGKDGRYWIFYVNGKMSDIGAGEYKIKNGDVVIWKFQKEGEKL